VPGWAAIPLEELPRAAKDEPGADWFPLQHVFGLTAFGANAFVAREAGDSLVETHDEGASGQEELYLVVSGLARFTLDGQTLDASAVTAVAVREPSVSRAAVALEPGTTLLALGGVPRDDFASTWRSAHFEGVPRVL
jgi:hypothetical protein